MRRQDRRVVQARLAQERLLRAHHIEVGILQPQDHTLNRLARLTETLGRDTVAAARAMARWVLRESIHRVLPCPKVGLDGCETRSSLQLGPHHQRVAIFKQVHTT